MDIIKEFKIEYRFYLVLNRYLTNTAVLVLQFLLTYLNY